MAQLVVRSTKNKDLIPLLDGAIKNELKIIEIGISKTQKHLTGFEEKYRLTSVEFYQRFQRGEMGDSSDFIRWAGEYETLKRLLDDKKELAEIEFC